jgi:mono/diheme cytochrome c family protein
MKYLAIAFVLFLFAACGGGQEQSTEQNSAPQSMVQPDAESEEAAPVVVNEAGKKIYDQYCLVCHQADGKGVPNAFPPLIQTEYVNGDTDRLIGIVLNGLSGEIEVNGETYNGVMVAHNFLNDTEVADVITYVRSNFGNNSPAVSADQVAAVRTAQ